MQTSETVVKLISGSQDSLIQMVSKYTMSLLISIRLIAPSIQNVRKGDTSMSGWKYLQIHEKLPQHTKHNPL